MGWLALRRGVGSGGGGCRVCGITWSLGAVGLGWRLVVLGLLGAGMPTLDWIGKKAVVNHHREVPYHVLRCDTELSVGEPGSGNLLVQGDNLIALKALLPYYAGKVKCIYIDPPYNTGQDEANGSGWVYSDRVDSEEIRRWFANSVGKEGEDLSRHDKWLCMMYPRVQLLREFLTDDGVIAVSIDDIELHRLRLLMDELFGQTCFLGQIAWKTRNTDNRVKSRLSTDHEYIVVYGRTPASAIYGRVIDRSNFKNPDNDPRGRYVTDPLAGKATRERRPNLHYTIVNPDTGDVYPPDPSRGWITDEAGYTRLLEAKKIWWPPDPATGKPRKKRFLSETNERMPASTFWADIKGQSGADELDQIMGERVFPFPKPLELMERVIDHLAGSDDIVLDSFGGSGTTAHAVLAKNKADGGNRRFILVEMDDRICTTITAERVKRVVEGYTSSKTEDVEGLGGGFRFCRLGPPLLDADGHVAGDIKFDDLARHTWFCETGEPWPRKGNGRRNPLLGVHKDTAIYLLFNGVLGDRSVNGGNVLTTKVLASLPEHKGPKVIYGEASRLGSERLKREGIVFKQIPYEVKGA
jgi:adenine-specific DNA-methyltransferase